MRRPRPGRGSALAARAIAIFAFLFCLVFLAAAPAWARILVPMDAAQTDHLKAYGLAYYCLEQGLNVEWLLNYRGGSFLMDDVPFVTREARLRGILTQSVDGGAVSKIYATIEAENMEVVLLEKAPRVAIYTPPNKQPWDDAVTLALAYADIPYDTLWDEEVLDGKLAEYDWLHLHHEDFTGQYGKFYASFHSAPWYQKQQVLYESLARAAGYAKVSEHKRAVAFAIRDYVAGGGFLFAMCSATDTFDIALAAHATDICHTVYDGDGFDPNANGKLDFTQCLAFHNFTVILDPLTYEYSNIDTSNYNSMRGPEVDYFTLFEFSAKHDPVPTMLTQDHVNVVNGFLGQTTGFRKSLLTDRVIVLAETEGTDEAKYIHGNYGQGTFTYYGGHDPEDYQHQVGDPPTDLSLHKNSPGYRLILNNILFPAARKTEQKT